MPTTTKKAKAKKLPMSGANDDVDFGTELKNLSGYDLDDVGNGRRVSAVHSQGMRFIKELKEWAIWDGQNWQRDEQLAMGRAMAITDAMKREARDLLRTATATGGKDSPEYAAASAYQKHASVSSSMGKLHAMLESASSQPGMHIRWEAFDSDPAILNCANGILVLGDKEEDVKLRPKSRDADLCLQSTKVSYDPQASSALWDLYLDDFFPDLDVRHWIQKLLGVSLFGRNIERMFVIGLGPTTSGKGMFISAMQAALGDYCGPFPLSLMRDNQDERARSDLIAAMPRRIIFTDEASAEFKLHADQVKRTTGDTAISARAPHSPTMVERVPAYVPWVLCNNTPEIRGRDSAIDKRIIAAPFMVSFDGRDDPSYKRRFLADPWMPPAVLAWMVEGWRAYLREGLLNTEPVSVMVAKERILSDLSDVDKFLSEACERGSRYKESSSNLFQAYERWCDMNGMHGRDRLTGVQFGTAIGNRGFAKTSVRVGGIGAKTSSGRIGVRVVEEWKL